MKTTVTLLALLGLLTPAFADANHQMSGMDHSKMTQATAKGAGVIKALDAEAGTITIDHGPIADLGWPAMTMPFKAAPALLEGLKVGQEVTFEVKAGDTPEIVSIQPAA